MAVIPVAASCWFYYVKSLLQKKKNLLRLRPKLSNVCRQARHAKLSFVYYRYRKGKFKICVRIRASSYLGLVMQYLCDAVHSTITAH